MGKKVVVGISGGVDSSVAAYLLKQQGYEVAGVTLQMWGNADMEAVQDARRICAKLQIPHFVREVKDQFKKCVMDYFVTEYKSGRTPNPCVVCNRTVKWEAMLRFAKEQGAAYVATGHYAGIRRLENGRYAVEKSRTAKKDQTYALYNLTQEQLSCTLMPLSIYEKEQVRAIAGQAGLWVADKPDSMEICFIPDNDYAGYLEHYDKETNGDAGAFQPGNFVDVAGKVLGQHKGIVHYTIGQRKGLGIAFGHPMFVTRICPQTNEVVLGKNEDLFSQKLCARQLNGMAVAHFQPGMEFTAKIRYAHKGEQCRIVTAEEDFVEIEFVQPVRAATPGQAVVFYDGDVVAGGGIIC